MKKITVLGSAGMAGHVVYDYLTSLNKYEVGGISRKEFDIEEDLLGLVEFLENNKPDIVINCMGLLIKASQNNPTKAIFINSLFPHILSDLPSRIIHLSTDCVFDGKEGNYSETSLPTDTGWYGRSKALGEIRNNKDLTLRTSIIGPELKENGTGLFDWFMHQTGEIQGFSNVMWNGITTLELAKQLDHIVDTNLSGLYHLVTDVPISKYGLLLLIQSVWNKTDVKVNQESNTYQNKVLINNRLGDYNPNIPNYPTQLEELKRWMDKK
jgi:dTDP-4-dehydrorhamnose reductase